MSKRHKKSERRPPRFRRIVVGQLWHVQKGAGHLIITGFVDEVTAETVVMRWCPDGSLNVRPDAPAVRYYRGDLMFRELVAQPEKVAA